MLEVYAMNRNKIFGILRPTLCITALSLLIGCNQNSDKGGQAAQVNDALKKKYSEIESFETSNDEGVIDIKAVVLAINKKDKTMNVRTVLLSDSGNDFNESQKEYILRYNEATEIKNGYDSIISIKQINPGEIVDVTYDSNKDSIAKISKQSEGFEISKIKGKAISQDLNTLDYGNITYKISENVLVLDEGKVTYTQNIADKDEITIRGVGNTIYSINLDKGHGIIELSGYSQFIGGYIEVGKDIYEVVKDQKITATEGNYRVILSKDDVVAVKNVTVARDKTVVVAFEEFIQEAKKQGTINFKIVPSSAKLYVDGVKQDYSKLVELEYGIHTISIVANGYSNYYETILVDTIYEDLTFDLTGASKEEVTTKEESTTKEETTTKQSATTTKQSATTTANEVKTTKKN